MTESEIEFLQQENARLKNELKEVREKEKGIHEDYKKQLSGARRDQALTLLLVGFKTQFDDLDIGVKDQALKEIISSRLAADSAELTVDESGQLLLRRKDGTNFFAEDHRLLDPNSYVEKIMVRDNILRTIDAQPDASNRQSGRNELNNSGRNNHTYNNSGNSAISPLIDQALKTLGAA